MAAGDERHWMAAVDPAHPAHPDTAAWYCTVYATLRAGGHPRRAAGEPHHGYRGRRGSEPASVWVRYRTRRPNRRPAHHLAPRHRPIRRTGDIVSVDDHRETRQPPGGRSQTGPMIPAHETFTPCSLGDLVAQHLTLHGTHRESTMPLLAETTVTGRQMAWTFIHIWRVCDGLIVEHWACRDDMGLLEQLRD